MRANPDVALRGEHNECPGCGQLFNSMKAFEKHRTGSHTDNGRRCLTVAQMEAIGMMRNAHGWWITEQRSQHD